MGILSRSRYGSHRNMDKPHGYRYSLAYIVDGERVIGYDNGEGKGDHDTTGGKSSHIGSRLSIGSLMISTRT